MERKPRTIQDLPDDLVLYLSDMGGFVFLQKFAKKYALESTLIPKLITLTEKLVLHTVPLEDLPAELEKLGVSPAKSKAAAAELAAERLLPIAIEVHDNVAGLISKWGGAAGASSSILTPEVYVQGVLNELGLAMEDKVLQHRAELLVASVIKGERTEEAAVKVMVRAPKVGGLGIKEEEAKALIGSIVKKAKEDGMAFGKPVSSEEVKEEEKKASVKVAVKDVKKAEAPPALAPVPTMEAVIEEVQELQKEPTVGAPGAQVAEPPVNPFANIAVPPAPPAPKPAAPTKNPFNDIKVPDAPAKPKKSFVPVDSGESKKVAEAKEKKSEQANPFDQVKVPDAPEKADTSKFEFAKVSKAEKATTPTSKDIAAEDLKKEDKTIKQKTTSPAPVLTTKKGDHFDDEDAKEVAEIAAANAKVINGKSDHGEKAVLEAIKRKAKLKLDPEAQKRFDQAIDARIRGIRDAYATKNLLENSPKNGGIGLKGAELAETSGIIEAEVHSYLDALEEKAKSAKQDALSKKKDKQKLGAKESKVMNSRYVELTGKAPTESLDPVAPTAARTSASTKAGETLARQAGQIDAEKVKRAVEAGANAPAKATVQLSGESAPTPSARPQVQDVRPVKRLAGPIDELGRLSLVEFRRLGANPGASTQKILDKISALEKMEGYDKKIAGISAWKRSPLNTSVLALSKAALISGKSIDAVAEEKQAAGEQIPTKEERDAIVALNAKLRF